MGKALKILPVSDLHLEFLDEERENELIGSLAEADVIVLAGDIIMARYLDMIRDSLGKFKEKYDHVVYVPGNHEFYRGVTNEVENVLRVGCNELGVHLLEPGRPAIIEGQRFIGGTMWYPLLPSTEKNKDLINDYRLIRNFEPWVYQQNKIFGEMLLKELRGDDVVVTHHLPSVHSIAPQYNNDPGNIFFVSERDDLISVRQPKLWIHGHTHNHFDYMLGRTRIICNPKGYPKEIEPKGFDPNLIVEV